MNNSSDTALESAGASDPGYSSTGPAYQNSSTRPFHWSVRRELWENRSIYVAPLIVAAVVLFGSFVGSFHLPGRRRLAMLLDPAHRRAAIELPMRHRCDDYHPDGICYWRFLLSRRVARRTPRSQHPFLEVASGFGSHNCPLEGDYSAE